MRVIDQEFDPAIPIASIQEHPDNPRLGNDEVVHDSIEELGFFGAIIVQRATGYVCAGNTRFRVMRDAGETALPGFWVDCSDDEADEILAVDNRASDLAYYDDSKLVALLTSIKTNTGNLDGSGYDDAAYELLIQAVNSDTILGGVRQGMTPGDRSEAFDASDIRSIILPYAREDYDRVVDALGELRTRWGLDTNAEVVLRLAVDEALDAAEG